MTFPLMASFVNLLFTRPPNVEVGLLDEHGAELNGDGYSRKPLGDSWEANISWECQGEWPRGPHHYALYNESGQLLYEGDLAVRGRELHEGDIFTLTLDMRIGDESLDRAQALMPTGPVAPQKPIEEEKREYVDPLRVGRVIDLGEDES